MLPITAVAAILATLALIVAHTGRLIYLKRWSAFDPLNAFWAGVFVIYVAQPLSYGAIYEEWHAPGVSVRTCFWVFFAMCFIVAGYESRLGSGLTRMLPVTPERLHGIRMQWCAYSAMLLGCVAYGYQFASAGGFSSWAAVGRGGTDWKSVSASIAQLTELLPFGIIMLIFEVEMHNRTVGKRCLAWSLGCFMWFWLFYLGSRSHIITFGCALLSAYYVPRRQNPRWYVLISCGLVLFMAVEFLGQYRSQFRNLSFNIEQEDLRSVAQNVLPTWVGGNVEDRKLGAQRGAEFNCVMSAVEVVPTAVPFDYGHALLEFVTRPIPKVFWPEKRYPHYEFFTEVMQAAGIPGTRVDAEYANLVAGPAFTFVGHWYAIGGPPALALMGLVTGALFRAVRGLYDRGRAEGDGIVYLVLAPLVGFNEAAATPLFFLFTVPYVLIPVLLLFRVAAYRQCVPHRAKITRHIRVP